MENPNPDKRPLLERVLEMMDKLRALQVEMRVLRDSIRKAKARTEIK